MNFSMFKTNKSVAIKEIYQSIIDSSRSKIFYIQLDIDDAFESRFDLVILHSFIIFQYFIESGDSKNRISQDLFDYMFRDFENNLREMGFGDIAVNTRMKKFITAFYGRILSYSRAYSFFKDNSSLDEFSSSIKKNIYKGRDVSEENINLISEYVVSNITSFLNRDYNINIDTYFKFNKIN